MEQVEEAHSLPLAGLGGGGGGGSGASVLSGRSFHQDIV